MRLFKAVHTRTWTCRFHADRTVSLLLHGLGIAVVSVVLAACSGSDPEQNDTKVSEQQSTQGATTEANDASAGDETGARVYAQRCASCHDNPDATRAPSIDALKAMSPAQIRFSMTSGKMQSQAAGLDQEQIGAVVNYLVPGGEEGYQVTEASRCEDTSISFKKTYVEGWGPDLSNTRYYGPERTVLDRNNVQRLETAWTFGLPGASDVRGYPVITDDTVFLGASSGHVFALDRHSGCIKWHNGIGVNVRSSLSLGDVDGTPAILFQDGATVVHALHARTGDLLWKSRAGVMPQNMGTATPVQVGDRLLVPLSAIDVGAAGDPEYECCKGHGAVTALDPGNGERLWTTHMTEPARPTTVSSVGTQLYGPAGAPVWTTPTLHPEARRVYVGTGENTSAPATDTSDAIIAMDLETGDILWKYQATENDTFNMACSGFGPDGPNCPDPEGPDFDFGGAVSLTRLKDGTDVIVGGQKSGIVHTVNADTGELIWKTRVSTGSALGGIHWGVTVSNGKVFAPSSDPAFPRPGYEAKPGLYALDLETGEPIWSHKAERGCQFNPATSRDSSTPWPECGFFYGYSAAPASTDELVFIGSLDGKIRAFDAATGDVLWTDETVKAFETVNGVAAHGGAIDNSGPSVAGDMLFVPSGYAAFGQMPGNAFIAYRLAEEE